MGKKAWIAFGIIGAIIIITVIVLILVLVPQVNSTEISKNTYENIERQDYTYSGNDKSDLDSTKEYTVTSSDLNKGLKTEKFKEGNINPFTPKNQVTIYNEPTLMQDYLKQNGNGTLTPNDK